MRPTENPNNLCATLQPLVDNGTHRNDIYNWLVLRAQKLEADFKNNSLVDLVRLLLPLNTTAAQNFYMRQMQITCTFLDNNTFPNQQRYIENWPSLANQPHAGFHVAFNLPCDLVMRATTYTELQNQLLAERSENVANLIFVYPSPLAQCTNLPSSLTTALDDVFTSHRFRPLSDNSPIGRYDLRSRYTNPVQTAHFIQMGLHVAQPTNALPFSTFELSATPPQSEQPRTAKTKLFASPPGFTYTSGLSDVSNNAKRESLPLKSTTQLNDFVLPFFSTLMLIFTAAYWWYQQRSYAKKDVQIETLRSQLHKLELATKQVDLAEKAQVEKLEKLHNRELQQIRRQLESEQHIAHQKQACETKLRAEIKQLQESIKRAETQNRVSSMELAKRDELVARATATHDQLEKNVAELQAELANLLAQTQNPILLHTLIFLDYLQPFLTSADPQQSLTARACQSILEKQLGKFAGSFCPKAAITAQTNYDWNQHLAEIIIFLTDKSPELAEQLSQYYLLADDFPADLLEKLLLMKNLLGENYHVVLQGSALNDFHTASDVDVIIVCKNAQNIDAARALFVATFNLVFKTAAPKSRFIQEAELDSFGPFTFDGTKIDLTLYYSEREINRVFFTSACARMDVGANVRRPVIAANFVANRIVDFITDDDQKAFAALVNLFVTDSRRTDAENKKLAFAITHLAKAKKRGLIFSDTVVNELNKLLLNDKAREEIKNICFSIYTHNQTVLAEFFARRHDVRVFGNGHRREDGHPFSPPLQKGDRGGFNI